MSAFHSDLNLYQQGAARTLTVEGRLPEQYLAICALGLAGEAGEVVELIKKHLGHGAELDDAKLEKELGDVLWYLAGIATLRGLRLQEIADANLEKLRIRFPEKFTYEDSAARRDVEPKP